MQTFNPTGTADLEVLFYLSGWWKRHILAGRFYYEWQSNGIKTKESDLDEKRAGRGTVKLKSTGRAELLTWELQGRRASRWEPRGVRAAVWESRREQMQEWIKWKDNDLQTCTVYLGSLTIMCIYSQDSLSTFTYQGN